MTATPDRCSAHALRAPVAPRYAPLMVAILAAFAPSAWAQLATAETGAAARLPFTFVPTFAASQTFTRNDALTPGEQRSELVTQLSPGVQIKTGSGRVKGYLNYALNTYSYARDSSQNNVQHELGAKVNAEAIPNFAYLDASASVSQQLASPFGQQFSNATVGTANRAQTRSYMVSPYVRGSFGGLVDYEARLRHSSSSSNAASQAGSVGDTALLQLSGGTAFSRLRWSASATHDLLNFRGGRKNTADTADVSLSYQLSPQFTLSANGGRESDNYLTADKRSSATSGIGFAWRPSEVTSLQANAGHHTYGNTHALNFSHRTGRTLWTYSDTRNVSNGFGQPVAVSLGTNYDLYYQLSTEPDPVLRDQQVTAFLKQRGISPNALSSINFLTSALTLERRQLLSAALQGVRDTLTLSFSRSESSQIASLLAVPNALAGSTTLRQQSVSVNLGHRLTPTASLNLNAAQQRISGTDGLTSSVTSTRLSTVELSWSDQIGRHTRATVSARRNLFDSATSPYTETALTAGISLQF